MDTDAQLHRYVTNVVEHPCLVGIPLMFTAANVGIHTYVRSGEQSSTIRVFFARKMWYFFLQGERWGDETSN